MMNTPWWIKGVAAVGVVATVLAGGLVWMVLTRPIAVAQALASW